MTRVAVDTSTAVPYFMRSHTFHDAVRLALAEYQLVIAGYSLAETYSVLTLVGLAARDAQLGLVTRDRRAATTYSALGLTFTLLPT